MDNTKASVTVPITFEEAQEQLREKLQLGSNYEPMFVRFDIPRINAAISKAMWRGYGRCVVDELHDIQLAKELYPRFDISIVHHANCGRIWRVCNCDVLCFSWE